MKRLILLLGLLILFYTCEDLKRNNPIDPHVEINAPTNLTVTLIDDHSLLLIWMDNCGYETGYRIERDDGGGYTQVGEVSADTTTFTDTNLTYGQSYSYRAKAFTTNNSSDYSNEVQIEIMIPAPSNLTASLIRNSEILLTWTDNCSFESGFVVERKVESGSYIEIARLDADVNQYTDSGLDDEITYYYRLAAFTKNLNFVINMSDFIEIKVPPMVMDTDGNVYQSVKIGSQLWTAENLKVTHYRSGDEIPNVTDNTAWYDLSTGAYCNYDNNTEYVDTYGRLYNWYAVNDSRNIAPTGWHVPTDTEWQILVDHLGGKYVAVGKLKEDGCVHWNSPNTGADNESGFTALPGGFRYSGGNFSDLGHRANFWSSARYNISDYAMNWILDSNNSEILCYNTTKLCGFSVRLVKN